MEPSNNALLILCYDFCFQESVQEKNVQQYSDIFLKDLPREFYLISRYRFSFFKKKHQVKNINLYIFIVYYCRPPLITDDGVVERTCKITFSADSKLI